MVCLHVNIHKYIHAVPIGQVVNCHMMPPLSMRRCELQLHSHGLSLCLYMEHWAQC